MFNLLKAAMESVVGKYAVAAILGAVGGIILASHLYFGPLLNEVRIASARYQANIVTANAKLAAAQNNVTSRVEIQYRDRIKIVKEKGNTIIKEVPIYVTHEDSAHFGANVGFVRSYNAAFTGTSAGPSSELDRKPAGIPLTDIADTTAFNASVCRQWREQALGLRALYRQLQQAEQSAIGSN